MLVSIMPSQNLRSSCSAEEGVPISKYILLHTMTIPNLPPSPTLSFYKMLSCTKEVVESYIT